MGGLGVEGGLEMFWASERAYRCASHLPVLSVGYSCALGGRRLTTVSVTKGIGRLLCGCSGGVALCIGGDGGGRVDIHRVLDLKAW